MAENRFESLDYVYVPAPDYDAAEKFYVGALGGELRWRIRDGGVTVGAVRLSPDGPLVLLASHLAPHWSAFSDSYPQIGADAMSWVVVLLEIAAALLLGAVGVRELRRASSEAPRAAVAAGPGRSTV